MRIHLHTFVSNPDDTSWDFTSELLRSARQSFWDYYAQWGISQSSVLLSQAQALHRVSADSDTFVVTQTYTLSRFHEIMKNLHKMSFDFHEVFIGADAGLAMIKTYIPCNNVYINWVGSSLPKRWHALPVHRWITSSHKLKARPLAAPYFNQVQHIGLAYIPAPDNFISSLPSHDQPRLASQNTMLFILAESNRPDGLHSGSMQMLSNIILSKLDYTHVSIASLNSMVSDNKLFYVSVNASGASTLSVDRTPSVPTGFNDLFANDSAKQPAHPNTFDTFIRNTSCSLIFSAASLEDVSKVLSTQLVINQRHRIYVVLTEDLSSSARDYIRTLHRQGYFNLVDLNKRSNQVSLLRSDTDHPLKKLINKELYNTLRNNGVTYPALGVNVSALSMYRRLRYSRFKVVPEVECHAKK